MERVAAAAAHVVHAAGGEGRAIDVINVKLIVAAQRIDHHGGRLRRGDGPGGRVAVDKNFGIGKSVLPADENNIVGVAKRGVDGVGGGHDVIVDFERLNQFARAGIVAEEGDVAFVVAGLENVGEDGEGVGAAGGDAG